MPTQLKQQTRGRPRKNNLQKLPQISRKLFSQHHAVFFTTCLSYVMEVFQSTKMMRDQCVKCEFQSGFGRYDGVNREYSFDDIEQDCVQWGFGKILQYNKLVEFIRLGNSCGPKMVFREILVMINRVVQLIQQEERFNNNDMGQQQQQGDKELRQQQDKQQQQLCKLNTVNIDMVLLSQHITAKLLRQQSQYIHQQSYKYIKFTKQALLQLGIQQKHHNQISSKVNILWKAFVQIIVYTVCCLINNKQQSVYYQLFFINSQSVRLVQIVQMASKIQINDNNCERVMSQQLQTHKNSINNSTIDCKNQPVSTLNKVRLFQPILLGEKIQQQLDSPKKRVKK